MQPQEPNLALPSWLPWATIACLAALLACASELWIVEKARNRLLREENLLAAAALKGAQNQLEAERILDVRELGEAKASASRAGEPRIALLSPPEGTRPEAGSKAPAWGVVVWGGRRALLEVSEATGPGSYQLWLDGSGPGYPADCGTYGASSLGSGGGVPVALGAPVAPGCQFLLFAVKAGGTASLREARSAGSIVLASLPYTERISTR